MDEWFRTSSGRTVHFRAMHVEGFDRGWYEGRPELIRSEVLADLPDLVRRIFPRHFLLDIDRTGILVSGCEGRADEYPRWVVVCEFHCFEPVRQHADYSSLTVVWFAEGFSWSIHEFVSARIGAIDWESHAVDGYY
jgi:hypothetical protein